MYEIVNTCRNFLVFMKATQCVNIYTHHILFTCFGRFYWYSSIFKDEVEQSKWRGKF